MKTKYTIITSLALIFTYLIIINLINTIIQNTNFSTIQNETIRIESGAVQEFGFGSSVQVSVTRPRFYGVILEQNKNSVLYFFYLIPLPLKNNNLNFIKFHLIFAVLLFIFILIFRKKETKKIYPIPTLPNFPKLNIYKGGYV